MLCFLGNCLVHFHMGPFVQGVLTVCSVVVHHWTRWLPCSYMVKKTLQSLLQILGSFEAESWYIASASQGLPSLFKWWSQDDLLLWGSTEIMLQGICRYAVAVLLRWANHDPWASCFYFSLKMYRLEFPLVAFAIT